MTNLYFLPNGNAQICWLQREIENFIRHQPKLVWFFPLWEQHGSNMNTRLLGWLVFFSLVYFNFVFCTSVESFVENTFCTLKNPLSPSFFLKNKNKNHYSVATSQLLFQLGCFKVQVSLIWKSLGFQFSPYNYLQKMEVYSHKSPCPKREKNCSPSFHSPFILLQSIIDCYVGPIPSISTFFLLLKFHQKVKFKLKNSM
jgi:hypothetical protein